MSTVYFNGTIARGYSWATTTNWFNGPSGTGDNYCGIGATVILPCVNDDAVIDSCLTTLGGAARTVNTINVNTIVGDSCNVANKTICIDNTLNLCSGGTISAAKVYMPNGSIVLPANNLANLTLYGTILSGGGTASMTIGYNNCVNIYGSVVSLPAGRTIANNGACVCFYSNSCFCGGGSIATNCNNVYGNTGVTLFDASVNCGIVCNITANSCNCIVFQNSAINYGTIANISSCAFICLDHSINCGPLNNCGTCNCLYMCNNSINYNCICNLGNANIALASCALIMDSCNFGSITSSVNSCIVVIGGVSYNYGSIGGVASYLCDSTINAISGSYVGTISSAFFDCGSINRACVSCVATFCTSTCNDLAGSAACAIFYDNSCNLGKVTTCASFGTSGNNAFNAYVVSANCGCVIGNYSNWSSLPNYGYVGGTACFILCDNSPIGVINTCACFLTYCTYQLTSGQGGYLCNCGLICGNATFGNTLPQTISNPTYGTNVGTICGNAFFGCYTQNANCNSLCTPTINSQGCYNAVVCGSACFYGYGTSNCGTVKGLATFCCCGSQVAGILSGGAVFLSAGPFFCGGIIKGTTCFLGTSLSAMNPINFGSYSGNINAVCDGYACICGALCLPQIAGTLLTVPSAFSIFSVSPSAYYNSTGGLFTCMKFSGVPQGGTVLCPPSYNTQFTSLSFYGNDYNCTNLTYPTISAFFTGCCMPSTSALSGIYYASNLGSISGTSYFNRFSSNWCQVNTMYLQPSASMGYNTTVLGNLYVYSGPGPSLTANSWTAVSGAFAQCTSVYGNMYVLSCDSFLSNTWNLSGIFNCNNPNILSVTSPSFLGLYAYQAGFNVAVSGNIFYRLSGGNSVINNFTLSGGDIMGLYGSVFKNYGSNLTNISAYQNSNLCLGDFNPQGTITLKDNSILNITNCTTNYTNKVVSCDNSIINGGIVCNLTLASPLLSTTVSRVCLLSTGKFTNYPSVGLTNQQLYTTGNNFNISLSSNACLLNSTNQTITALVFCSNGNNYGCVNIPSYYHNCTYNSGFITTSAFFYDYSYTSPTILAAGIVPVNICQVCYPTYCSLQKGISASNELGVICTTKYIL